MTVTLLVLAALVSLPAPCHGAVATPDPFEIAAPAAAGAMTGDGGGPFSGLASLPEASAFTGAAATAVTIEVPPGRAGMTPRLALSYSSTLGPGPYGQGWSMGLARIARSTKQGPPAYDASDLLFLHTGQATVELRLRDDGLYSTYPEAAHLLVGFDEAANTWKVLEKNGTTHLFGTGARARRGPAPAEPGGTFSWYVSETRDGFGNSIEYRYHEAADVGGMQALPASVHYGGNSQQGLAHMFEVRFAWTAAPRAADRPVSWAAGFAELRTRLLSSIDTLASGRLVRRYALGHEHDATSGLITLAGLSLEGFAAEPRDDVVLPSTVFVYSDRAEIRESAATVFPSPGPLRDVGRQVLVDTFDIDGDAIPDHVDLRTGTARIRRGTGAGFGPPEAWPWPSGSRAIRATSGGNDLYIAVIDMTGDGLIDLVNASPSACGPAAWCVYRNNVDGFDEQAIHWPAPHHSLRIAHSGGKTVLADTADINGDGLPDSVDAGYWTPAHPYWRVHLNNGNGFEGEAVEWRAHKEMVSRYVSCGDDVCPLWRLADMNGDRLADLVQADPHETGIAEIAAVSYWSVYLNTGRGFMEEARQWRVDDHTGDILPSFISKTGGDADSSTTLVDLVDLTGDGLPDLVRPGVPGDAGHPECCQGLLVFVNTGVSFSAPVTWAAWDPTRLRHYLRHDSSERQFDIFDVDGDGLIDLVELEDGNWRVFGRPAKPGLLLAMMNGIGGTTLLEYRAVASLDGNRLPFAHWVVSARELVDSVSWQPASRTTYEYRGALFDAPAREFRGFRSLCKKTGGRPALRTVFHQDELRAGLIERSETLAGGDDSSCEGRPILRRDSNGWPDTEPLLLESRRSVPWTAGMPVDELATLVEFAYDGLGNISSETVSSPTVAAVMTQTRYVEPVISAANGIPSLYVADRPASVVTRTVGETVPLLEQDFEYGLASGAPRETTSVAQCMNWDGSGLCERWSRTSFAYDGFGNPVEVRAPEANTTSYRLDEHRLYAVRTSNAYRRTSEQAHDIATGRLLWSADLDGRRRGFGRDGLGRLVRSWGPGFTSDNPRTIITYSDGAPGCRPGQLRIDRFGQAPVVAFYDGLGRQLATKTLRETGQGLVTVVSGLGRHDSAGRLVARAADFEAPETDLERLAAGPEDARAWTEWTYDGTGRPTETRWPDGSRSLFDLSLPGLAVTADPNLAAGAWPGKARLELLDGLGRVWRRDLCSAMPAGPDCPPGTLLARTEYEYDGLDRPVLTRHLGTDLTGSVETKIAYNGLGSRVTVTSPAGGIWRHEYDEAGRLLMSSSPGGSAVRNRYDRLGRLSMQRATGFKTRFRYNKRPPGAGLLRRVQSKSGKARTSKHLYYDARGRVAAERIRIRANGPNRRFKFEYGYDAADRRTSIVYPSSEHRRPDRLHTGYSQFGLPLTLELESAVGNRRLVEAADYDIRGRLVAISYGNGLTDLFGFQDNGTSRLACLRTTSSRPAGPACEPGNADLTATLVEERDSAGNITFLTEPGRGSLTQRYDELGRLVEWTGPAGAAVSFDYDSLGNLLRRDHEHYLYEAASPQRPVSAGQRSLDFDADGRLRTHGSRSYDYDSLGRLVGVLDDGQALLKNYFDESERRVASVEHASGKRSYYFGEVFDVRDAELHRHFRFGDMIVASDIVAAGKRLTLAAGGGAAGGPVTEATAFYHRNHRGSVTLVSDSGGQAAARSSFGPYGRRLTGAAGVGFAGRREEPGGLIYFGARFYDPELALFTSTDARSQFASPYLYGGGNPANGLDTDGELFGLLGAIFQPILFASAVSGTISAVVAGLSGGDIADAFTAGLASGALGAGIGTVLGAANIGYQTAAGGARMIETAEALSKLVEVSRRASFAATVAHAAGSTADALGLGSDWVTGASLVGGLAGSYYYDSRMVADSGAASTSQRGQAKAAVTNANTTTAHANITTEAAVDTGWASESASLLRENLAADGGGGGLTERITAALNNQGHFGRLPQTMKSIVAGLEEVYASADPSRSGLTAYRGEILRAMGRATHLVQDHLTLGHMVPGTSAFAGALGAPLRFVIHQSFGGEIAFRRAQLSATRALLGSFPPPNAL